MKKVIFGVVLIFLFIGVGYLYTHSQVKQQTQVTASKTGEIQPVDLLKRIQLLEKELTELKQVIQISRTNIKIQTPGIISLQSAKLELNAALTTVDHMNAKISFDLAQLQGTAPNGPAFIPLPKKIPAVITK